MKIPPPDTDFLRIPEVKELIKSYAIYNIGDGKPVYKDGKEIGKIPNMVHIDDATLIAIEFAKLHSNATKWACGVSVIFQMNSSYDVYPLSKIK